MPGQPADALVADCCAGETEQAGLGVALQTSEAKPFPGCFLDASDRRQCVFAGEGTFQGQETENRLVVKAATGYIVGVQVFPPAPSRFQPLGAFFCSLPSTRRWGGPRSAIGS